ncbi:hypothetical protein G6M89_08055 [Natronolimnobius sp. AArcel1]|uniref:hypothetical protein n=1 Tax=Natronolimnobius sp. AArcel1 TaxID=1679093 RepID=UPI0013EBF584|nr:hypothetical protein [Natronolimnobius sp. AArcel1]NGM68965.1 hypothetical protein [Natronolimnobius sp. AArcel1]
MVVHGTHADQRSSARRLLTVFLLVIAIAFAGAVIADVAVGEDSQDDSEDAIERSGHNLSIGLTDVDGDVNEVRVTVEDTDVLYEQNATDESQIDIDVTQPEEGTVGGTSLIDPNVTVTAVTDEDEETLVDGVPVGLHAVSFASEAPVWIDEAVNEGESDILRVPLYESATTGVADGDEVSVVVNGDEEAPLTGIVSANASQLALEREELKALEDVSVESEIGVDVRADDESVTEDPHILEAELRSIDDQLVFWHPLLVDRQTYDIVADDGNGQYVSSSVEPSQPGALELSSLSPDATIDIDVTGNDFELEETELEYNGAFEMMGTVQGGDSTVMFDENEWAADLEVTSAVLESEDDQPQSLDTDGIDEDGSLSVTLEDGALTEDDSLLLQTPAGVASVTLEESTPGETDEESDTMGAVLSAGQLATPVVLSLAFGLGIGVVGARFGGSPTPVTVGLASLIGFCLTLATTLIVLLMTDSVQPIDSLTHGIAASGVLLATVLAPTSYYLLGKRFAAGPTGFTADVAITDGSDPITEPITVYYEKGDGSRAGKEQISGGGGNIRLPSRGAWKLVAERGTDRSDPVEISHRSASATLTVTSATTLAVVDQASGEAIPNATVRTTDGSIATDKRGRVTIEPPTDDSSTHLEAEFDHEKYHEQSKTVRFDRRADGRVRLAPRTGRMQIVSRIDGVATESMALRVTPAENEQFLRYRSEGFEETTGGDGVATRDDVLVGTYRVGISSPGNRSDIFAQGETDVVIREGDTARVDVDAQFTWTLSPTHKDQIARIRDDLRSLSAHSGRDTSIPAYYASVVESMLETVESMPDAGHHFAGAGADPDSVADAVLEAAAKTTDAINDAMTTKRNIDLFAACADMSEPRSGARWRGEHDLEELLERLADDPMSQRNELKQRYEAVAGQIEDARQDVSEVAPAREMHRRAWDMVGDTDRGDDAIAIVYASLLVLDSVEKMFEHDFLRERLSRTVF